MKNIKKNLSANKRKKFEQEYFDGHFKEKVGEFSPKRDKEMANWFRGAFHFVDKYVPIEKSKDKKIIEFGCAYGSASSVLQKFGLKVTATDISKLAIDRAKKLHPEITFKVHDIEKPFNTKEKFDYVLATDVVEHLEKPEVAIRRMYEVLKKGGTAIVSTQNDFPYKTQDPTHISVKNPEEWRRIFIETGFSDVVIQPATYVPPFLYRYHWRLNLVIPIAVFSTIFLSTVFIFAKK